MYFKNVEDLGCSIKSTFVEFVKFIIDIVIIEANSFDLDELEQATASIFQVRLVVVLFVESFIVQTKNCEHKVNYENDKAHCYLPW